MVDRVGNYNFVSPTPKRSPFFAHGRFLVSIRQRSLTRIEAHLLHEALKKRTEVRCAKKVASKSTASIHATTLASDSCLLGQDVTKQVTQRYSGGS
jgi:hypothetical protein